MIASLRLQNFRSYSDKAFDFRPGVNLIVGPNAGGKTNLLEAILVLCKGASFRAKDVDLVQFDKPWTRLDAKLSGGGSRTVKIVVEPSKQKTYELDGKTYKRLLPNHTIPVVLFEPEHLRLLSGGPERRRDYLDDLLEQTEPGYGIVRRQYVRTLAQRNALLKQGNMSAVKLFPWNLRLSQLGGNIVRSRTELVGELQKNISTVYQQVSDGKTKTTVAYQNQWPVEGYETKMLKELDAELQQDVQRGFTGAGPHREDLVVFFDGRPAQEVASRGEVRTAVLVLKILELWLLEAARGVRPLLLLDDVFSELDTQRRHTLTHHLANYQTFITTTDADTTTQQLSNSLIIKTKR